MVHIDTEHLTVMMEAGYVYLGMRRFKEARQLFEGLCVLAPDSDVPLVALGNVDFCENRLAQAVKRYEQALDVDPQSVYAKVYMGEALLFAGEKEKGAKLLKDVAKADKGGAGQFATALLDAVKQGFEPRPPKAKGKR